MAWNWKQPFAHNVFLAPLSQTPEQIWGTEDVSECSFFSCFRSDRRNSSFSSFQSWSLRALCSFQMKERFHWPSVYGNVFYMKSTMVVNLTQENRKVFQALQKYKWRQEVVTQCFQPLSSDHIKPHVTNLIWAAPPSVTYSTLRYFLHCMKHDISRGDASPLHLQGQFK